MESVQNLREPFKKKILLSNAPYGISTYLPMEYDSIFHIQDTNDWTLFLTYSTYAPKPILVVSEDIVIPSGLWSKLSRRTTFVNFTRAPVMNASPYDAIFFATEDSTTYTEYVCKLLQSIYRANYGPKEHKEILQELRVAKAGLAWTKVDDDAPTGSLCWYDPVPTQTGEKMTPAHMAELLTVLAMHLRA